MKNLMLSIFLKLAPSDHLFSYITGPRATTEL